MPRPISVRLPALATTLVLLAAVHGAAPAAEKSDAKPPKAKAPMTAGMQPSLPSLPGIDLPAYTPPESYSVDLVIHAEGQDMTMKRFIGGGRIRSEMSAQGQDMVMIEANDEKGTTYMLMPGDKRAIKQTRAAMEELADKVNAKEAMVEQGAKSESESAAPADLKVEDLGDETIDGHAVKKLKFAMSDGDALGWFDKATGAPVKMESNAQGHHATLEWKHYAPGPQPDKLFEIPKGYEVTDMDEMMSKMKSMKGGMGMGSVMSGLAGGGVAGAMGGGMGGMAKGMAGNMASNFGSSMGGSFGASLGGALGGPLGAIAGQYIGGKVGGLIGKKTADAVIPGK